MDGCASESELVATHSLFASFTRTFTRPCQIWRHLRCMRQAQPHHRTIEGFRIRHFQPTGMESPVCVGRVTQCNDADPQESVKTCFLEEHSLHGRVVDVKPAWENTTRKPGDNSLMSLFPSPLALTLTPSLTRCSSSVAEEQDRPWKGALASSSQSRAVS